MNMLKKFCSRKLFIAISTLVAINFGAAYGPEAETVVSEHSQAVIDAVIAAAKVIASAITAVLYIVSQGKVDQKEVEERVRMGTGE